MIELSKMHGKHTRIYIDGYDLSADFNSFEPGYAADTAEVSGFTDETKKYVVGLADPAIRMGGIFNDSTAPVQNHSVLSARVATDVMLNGIWGTNALQYGAGGSVALNEYSLSSPISGAVSMNASLAGAGSSNGPFEFIQTLMGKQSVGTPATGVDTGAAFANGLSGHLQFFSGTGTIRIQSSTAAAGPTWTDRIDFGARTAPFAARATVAGFAAQQFLRGIITGVGTAWLGFKRL